MTSRDGCAIYVSTSTCPPILRAYVLVLGLLDNGIQSRGEPDAAALLLLPPLLQKGPGGTKGSDFTIYLGVWPSYVTPDFDTQQQ